MQMTAGKPTRWRLIGWGGAILLLLLPLIAMQFTSDVAWTASDFMAFAVMLLAAGGAIELAARVMDQGLTRMLAIGAVIFAFLWLWAELAVGIFTTWGS